MKSGVTAGGALASLIAFLAAPVGNGLPLIAILFVTFVSCALGMLAKLGRVEEARAARSARRKMVFNFGAVWLLSLIIALWCEADLIKAIAAGLGIGLAGGQALDWFESLAMSKLRNAADELDGRVARLEGRVRQVAQISDIVEPDADREGNDPGARRAARLKPNSETWRDGDDKRTD